MPFYSFGLIFASLIVIEAMHKTVLKILRQWIVTKKKSGIANWLMCLKAKCNNGINAFKHLCNGEI